MVGFLNAGGGRGGGIGNKLTVTAPANTSVTARLMSVRPSGEPMDFLTFFGLAARLRAPAKP